MQTEHRLTVLVRNDSDTGVTMPVRGGIPLPPGFAAEDSNFAITDSTGSAMECQTRALSNWPCGSIRWLLIDLSASLDAGETRHYYLSTDTTPQSPSSIHSLGTSGLSNGLITIEATPSGILIANDNIVDLTMENGDGRTYECELEETTIEDLGPVRGTMCSTGHLIDTKGHRGFSFRLRTSLYAGSTRLKLEPQIMIDGDTGVIHRIRDLRLTITPNAPLTGARFDNAISEFTPITNDPYRRLQIDDRLTQTGSEEPRQHRSTGSMEIQTRHARLSVAMRDFWQQWPKDLTATTTNASIGLFPRFEAGQFDHMEPWYKYQYLFHNDCYQLRTGQSRRWEIWIDQEASLDSLTTTVCTPLTLSAPSNEALGTGAWGPSLQSMYLEWRNTITL